MNVSDLKQGFDRVEIKHFNSKTYKATHVALVKNSTVYVGTSKCHGDDQFNRKLGREIAIGRAMHAWKVDAGILPARKDTKHVAVFPGLTKEGIDSTLEALDHEPVLASCANVSSGGCCGGGSCKD
jgi:hypothetical protein